MKFPQEFRSWLLHTANSRRRKALERPDGATAWLLPAAGAVLCFGSGLALGIGGSLLWQGILAAVGGGVLAAWAAIQSGARRHAEAQNRQSLLELQENERLLRLMTDNMADLITVTDSAGRRIYTSPSHERLLGHPMPGEQRASPASWIHPDDIPRFVEARESALRSREVCVVEVRGKRSDGGWLFLECTVSVVPGADGTAHLLTVGRDITERRAAWQAVRESQSFLQSLVDSLPQNILRKDRAGRFTFANSKFAAALGRPLPEIIGRTDSDFFPAELAAKYREDDLRVMTRGHAVELVESHRTPDGQDVYVQVVKSPVVDAAGEVVGLQVMFWDVTEREVAQRSLRRSYMETESLMASISAVLVGVDIHGRVSRWNRAAETMFGIPAAEAIGQNFSDCPVQWDWRPVRQATIDCQVHRKTVEVTDVVCRRPHGKQAVLHLILSPDSSDAGRNLQFTLLATDVTERRSMEDQFRHVQKLESIGQLAAGIAHEINTPTQFMGDNLRFLRDSFGELAPVFESLDVFREDAGGAPADASGSAGLRAAVAKTDIDYLRKEIPTSIDQALEGVARVAAIVGAMKEFSRPNGVGRAHINLNDAIESTATVARNEWKYVADLVMELDPDLPRVPCFPGDINVTVLNLIVNAAHAIADTPAVKAGGKGVITLRTRHVGDAVEIRIRDNGVGIPEAIQGRIFDPFFTTKEVGKGTGQGLFIAHNLVVEKHGGEIRFETGVGVGTTFILRLPLHERQIRVAA